MTQTGFTFRLYLCANIKSLYFQSNLWAQVLVVKSAIERSVLKTVNILVTQLRSFLISPPSVLVWLDFKTILQAVPERNKLPTC